MIAPSKRLAHIISSRTAYADVEKARVNRTELTALCGHKFTPKYRDPLSRPTCSRCVQLALALHNNPPLTVTFTSPSSTWLTWTAATTTT